jgi:hypothetical protein
MLVHSYINVYAELKDGVNKSFLQQSLGQPHPDETNSTNNVGHFVTFDKLLAVTKGSSLLDLNAGAGSMLSDKTAKVSRVN